MTERNKILAASKHRSIALAFTIYLIRSGAIVVSEQQRLHGCVLESNDDYRKTSI